MEITNATKIIARERRRKLDHDRYMRQRELRLKKRYDEYHADIEVSREYYRNYRKKRAMAEIQRIKKGI